MLNPTPKKIKIIDTFAIIAIVITILICATILVNSIIIQKTTTKFSCQIDNIEYDQKSCYYNNTKLNQILIQKIMNPDGTWTNIYSTEHYDCIKPHNIKCEGYLSTDITQLINGLHEVTK